MNKNKILIMQFSVNNVLVLFVLGTNILKIKN
jgi:hypothetical protein